jgi:Phytanoyl-CoA dioxygenase (PhyH)
VSGVTSGVLTPEERYLFDLQGFLVRRGALSDDEIVRANEAIDALQLPRPGDSIGSQRFAGYVGKAEIFGALMDHLAVIDIVTELCGPDVRLDHTYGIHMAPGTAGLDLHGGPLPWDPCQYYVADVTGIHCGLVAVQWALADAWPGDGGFACVPGSHKARFDRPDTVTYGHAVVREVPLRAGDMVIFTEALTHGTFPWKGKIDRRTILYKYAPGSISWHRDPPVTAEAIASLSPRQRRLCQPPSVAYHEPV